MQDLRVTMQAAMQLMRAGDLHGATRAIRSGLRGDARTPHTAAIDGEYRVVRDDGTSPGTSGMHASQDAPRSHDARGTHAPQDSPRSPHARSDEGMFTAHRFRCDHGTIAYKLFVPHGVAARAPLLVMLHGCTQSPDDFARGTRMNDLAQELGYIVVYPAQPRSSNPQKCWNWFRADDQQRGAGEPALIAALTRELVRRHGVDERRVYAAGLSAGGAMAAVLGATYPDVYAAVGVHSGLPFAAAHDLPSALAAMKRDTGAAAVGRPVPAIVFHGDGDMTVDCCNGAAVIRQFVADDRRSGDPVRTSVERGSVAGGHRYTRVLYRRDDTVIAEHWEVHGGSHAWFGGDRAGSYTDPRGPDASSHMLRFFSACRPATLN